MSGKITFVLIIAIAMLAACNNSSGPRSTTYKPVNLNIPTKAGPLPSGQPQTNPVSSNNPVATVASPQPVTTVAAAGLNPEHGKPGHRCDIAVGAPLNSPATTPTIATNTPTTNNNPVTITPPQPIDIQKLVASAPATTPTTAISKAGLNPEHGKPGHRCDIAVGAPLDSKPTVAPAITTTPANNTPVTTTSIPQPTPLLPATTPVKTDGVTAAGMNPEHGKPGHRCDIAVGAPLDSKPVTATEKKN